MKYSRKTGLLIPNRRELLIATGVLLLALLFGGALIYAGAYNISALSQHTPPVYKLLQYAMERSAGARAEQMEPPESGKLDRLAGLALYDRHCTQCHGAPGESPQAFSLGMVPAPTAIASIAVRRSPKETFWLIKNGIKMTGMPAWRFRMSDREIWQVVAFIEQVATLTVPEYVAMKMEAAARYGIKEGSGQLQPDPISEPVEYGRVALQQYNCASCHEIPGVTAANNHVGPPLGGVAGRAFIAGLLPNTDENLVKWIRFPHEVDPKSMMPDMGVSEQHARMMVRYFRYLEEN